MRGPCACPGGDATGWSHRTQTTRQATRTSTRPPPCPTAPLVPTGCRTPLPRCGRQQSSGGGDASVPMSMITPFGWQNSLGIASFSDQPSKGSDINCIIWFPLLSPLRGERKTRKKAVSCFVLYDKWGKLVSLIWRTFSCRSIFFVLGMGKRLP